MSLIAMTPPEQAQGLLAETYREIQQTFGRIPNAFRIASSSPAMLNIRWQSTQYYRNHPTLGMPLLATIRMLVSEANDCAYCVDFNAGLLINHCEQTPEQVAATRKDPVQSPLPHKDKAMLLFVLKAQNAPASVVAEDLAELRTLGWTDADMLDAVTHAANNLAVDMILNTFKVEQDF